MFTFKCQCCGVKMGDFPPMEALTVQQGYVVFGDDQPSDLTHMQDVLFGTPFEGMSTGQFCTFCLIIIRKYPEMIAKRSSEILVELDYVSNHRVYNMRRSMVPKGVEMPMVYLIEGISWTQDWCPVPSCHTQVVYGDEETWEGRLYCDDHKGYVSLRNFLETMKRDYHERFWMHAAIYFGHDFHTCECKDCFNTEIEWWDIEREAHMEEYYCGGDPDHDDDEEAF